MTVPGQYILQEQSSGDPPSVQLTGEAIDQSLFPAGTNDTFLSPGVYSIQFEASTGGPVQVQLFVRLSSDETEIVLANGVGQGPALSLRLIAFSDVTRSSPSVPVTPPAFGPFPIALPEAIASGTIESLQVSRALLAVPLLDTPAATTSYSGLGPGLVGRPFDVAYGPETTLQETAPGTELGSSQGAARGQSLRAFPSGPARFPWESATSTGGYLEDSVASPPTQASMIDFDLRRGMATVEEMRGTALRQRENFLKWAESWFGKWPMREDTSTRGAGMFPELGRRQQAAGTQPNLDDGRDEWARASSRTFLLSPHIVVLSVAAIAQVCWHYARWWKTRGKQGRERTDQMPTLGTGWDRLDVSLLIGSHARAGSHELVTVLQRPRSV